MLRSAMRRILEDVHVDWKELISLSSERQLDAQTKMQLRQLIGEVCRLFTLNISPREKTLLEESLLSTPFPMKEEVANLLQRCARRDIAEVDIRGVVDSGGYPSPEPSIAVTSGSVASLLPRSIGATEITSTSDFQHSECLGRAREGLVQIYSLRSSSLSSVWENVFRPFSRASRIYLCDPYVVKNFWKYGRESGLSFLLERWGALAQEEGRKMMISVMSGNCVDDEMGCLTKHDLESIVDELVSIGHVNAVRVRLVRKKSGVLHARNLIASEGSVACRGLVLDDSIPQINQVSDKLQTISLVTHPTELGILTNGFGELMKRADLDVARKAPS